MHFVNTDTKEILNFANLKLAHPKTSFPKGGPSDDWLADEGYAILKKDNEPKPGPEQAVEQTGIKKVNGEWQRTYQVTDIVYTKDQLSVYTELTYKPMLEVPITLHGLTIVPDDKTLNRLNNKIQAMRIRDVANETATWIGPEGAVDLTAAQLEDFGVAADEQWQPLFAVLPTIFGGIATGAITTKADIDAALGAV